MRALSTVNAVRDCDWEMRMGGLGDDDGGCFRLKSDVDGKYMSILVSRGSDGVRPYNPPWDHVSVSRVDRCPDWSEMEQVKRVFFQDDETAMQLHVPPSDHVNCHPYCLHLWRPTFTTIPRPPSIMVGPS